MGQACGHERVAEMDAYAVGLQVQPAAGILHEATVRGEGAETVPGGIDQPEFGCCGAEAIPR